MTSAEKRARKKENHRNGEKAIAARALRARQHAYRISAAEIRKQTETQEVDDFLGGPLPKPAE